MKFLNQYFKFDNGMEVVGLTNELNVLYILDYFQKNTSKRFHKSNYYT